MRRTNRRGSTERRGPVRPRLGHALLLVGVSALVGCTCDDEHPYTPFQVPSSALRDALPPGSSLAAAPSASAAPSTFAPAEAPAFTGAEQREWRAGDLVVRPRDGHRLDRGFAADLNGDGVLEAVVWSVPSGDPPRDDRGQLWFYGKNAPPAPLTAVPPFVPSGPGCTTEARLWQSGPHTATIDVRAKCTARLLARAPTRAVVVVAPWDERAERLTLRVADPAPGETLSVMVDSRDADGDGRDDVLLDVTMTAGIEERAVHVPFTWLDRAAGLAREAAQPRKSFEDIGSIEVVRAKGPKTSRAVRERVENARRLYASACAESGVARLFDNDGSPLACGDLRRAFERYAEAEIAAAVTSGRAMDAAAAYLRAGWYHGRLDEKASARLRGLLDPVLPVVPVEEKTLPVRARERGSEPRWSPLRFEGNGSLLVMTSSGIERFDADGGSVGGAEEEIDPWPLTVVGPDGGRWGGLAFSCDRSEALFLMSSPDGSPAAPEPARLLSPRPGGCRGGQFPELPIASPLVWEEKRRIGFVAGNLAVPLDAGDAELPEGRWFAGGSALGLLVFSKAGAKRWDAPKPADLGDCVVSPNADRVACVRGGSLVTVLKAAAAPANP